MFNNIPVITIEEHYWDRELFSKVTGQEGIRGDDLLKRLYDLGELRLREMDEAGVDMQVLSLGAPGAQKLKADIANDVAKGANDRLAEAVARHPTRFAAFASLPTPVPEAAALELERCVKHLGFKGAMIHGLANGTFVDDRRFWPIYERAQALDVPIYIHPAVPHPAVSSCGKSFR